MIQQDLNRIVQTLAGVDSSHKYYVYMLLHNINGTPFYIGKGEGLRVLEHLKEAQQVQQQIQQQNNLQISVDSESLENLGKEISTKIQTILTYQGNIIMVIIKWGLTEDEAFMAESALINMYDFLHPDSLTNIVNGHASLSEKLAINADGFDTKARTLDKFLEKVAIKPIDVNQFLKDNTLSQVPIIFIKNNTSVDRWESERKMYPNVSKADFLYDSIRGFWVINLARAQKARYVIGLSRGVVTGVYPVDGSCWGRLDGTEEYVSMPTYPRYFRVSDDKIRNSTSYNDYLAKYGAIYNSQQKGVYCAPIPQAKFNKTKGRFGFDKLVHNPDTHPEYVKLQELVGTYLTDKFLKNQNPVNYNYE